MQLEVEEPKIPTISSAAVVCACCKEKCPACVSEYAQCSCNALYSCTSPYCSWPRFLRNEEIVSWV